MNQNAWFVRADLSGEAVSLTAPCSQIARNLKSVEVVMMQTVNHAIGAHGNATCRAKGAPHRVVQPARFVEPVVGGIVGQDEERVLESAYQQHRWDPRRP
jgi:hypothetical protein